MLASIAGADGILHEQGEDVMRQRVWTAVRALAACALLGFGGLGEQGRSAVLGMR